MAKITAVHLAECPRRAGPVVMKAKAAASHSYGPGKDRAAEQAGADRGDGLIVQLLTLGG